MSVTILVVDDEIQYQHLLRVNLESEGYSVVTRGDGEAAIDAVTTTAPIGTAPLVTPLARLIMSGFTSKVLDA